jgi:hypothetical protein
MIAKTTLVEKMAVDSLKPLEIPRPVGPPWPALLSIALGIFLFGGIGPHMALAALSVLVLVVGMTLLWRPGESPILLLIFGYQWMQASIPIFKGNWLGLGLNDISERHLGDMDTAIALTLVGLASLALGIRWGAGPRRVDLQMTARHVALSQPISRWFLLYVVGSGVAAFSLAFAWTVPGLSQPMLALASIKWAFFFMLAYATFVRASGINLLFATAFAIELAQGVGGFFSDFKTVFFFTLLAGGASGKRISLPVMFGLCSIVALLTVFGIVWTAVKDDYRKFVSGGDSATQFVTSDYGTAIAKLGDLIGELDSESLTKATNGMLNRLTYVEYFGIAIGYVPRILPHEGGALMWDAIRRPFMPRVLFSDKSAIDDTERTNLYTGGAAGNYYGTTISLGWIAETYIDFGEYLMMGAIFLIGYFYGRIYRWCLDGSGLRGSPLGFAFASSVLLSVLSLENSFTNSFGGIVVSVLVVWLIVNFAVPRWCPWLVPPVSR